MAGELVLITGATGFIGYQVLVSTLKAGYRVRCAVRSLSGVKNVVSAPSIKELSPTDGQLFWVVVPDISAPHAYDEAVKGVDYILHVASPVPNLRGDGPQGDDEEIYIKPAVNGVIGMFESAASHATSTLKRIVVTSSIVAVIPPIHFAKQPPASTPAYDGETRTPNISAPYSLGFGPYQASKIAALNAADAWIKEHSTSFDVVNIMPAWVFGRDELSTTTKDLMGRAGALVIKILTGVKTEHPVNEAVVSVEDVAAAHILALNPSVAGNQSFVLGRLEKLDDAVAFAKKAFPEAFESGIFKEGGFQTTVSIPMDDSETEKQLGLRQTSYEDIVKAVAGQFLELNAK